MVSGCGNYGVLKTLNRTFEELDLANHNIALISGIGCSSRLPYYMNTYGFHTLHGRAPTVATGLKMTRPDLSVWVVTGDGDCLAIGGNHFIHAVRRDLDINIIIFNNEIYGLTKGQASPTTRQEQSTKSTPFGVPDAPINPLSLALSSGASFVARTVDTHLEHLQEVLAKAYHHRGTSVVEVLVNCSIFNDGVFAEVENRRNLADTTIRLRDGEPMTYGQQHDRAISFDSYLNPQLILKSEVNPEIWQQSLEFEFNASERQLALTLASIDRYSYPLPIGIFYQMKSELSQSLSSTARSEKSRTQQSLIEKLKGSQSWTF